MGKDRGKHNKQLAKNGDRLSDQNSSRKESNEPHSPFEINGESALFDSNSSIDDQRENILSKLFPWRSSSDSPERRREEMQLRVAASALLVPPNPASLLPLIKALSVHRDCADPSVPVIPHLLLAALTKGCAKKAHYRTPSFRFSELPTVIKRRIGSLSQSMPELRLVDRATLTAVTGDAESYSALNELSTLARIRHLFLDRSKIRKNRLFDSNVFLLEKVTACSSAGLRLVNGNSMIGCTAGPDHFYARKPETTMGNGELRWVARLSQIGIPLWVYEIIRPTFIFKFNASYEPGDTFEVKIGLITRESHDEFFFVSPFRQKITKIGAHAIEYEMVLSDLPLPVSHDSSPLDLCFHLHFTSQREDTIVYNLECRCMIPTGEEFANRVADFDLRREQVHGRDGEKKETPLDHENAAREPSFVKTMFPEDDYNPLSALCVKKLPENIHSSETKNNNSASKPFLQGKHPAKNVAGRRK